MTIPSACDKQTVSLVGRSLIPVLQTSGSRSIGLIYRVVPPEANEVRVSFERTMRDTTSESLAVEWAALSVNSLMPLLSIHLGTIKITFQYIYVAFVTPNF